MSAPALGADPAAPPGAPAIWLPNEVWVLDHWLPYKESTLDSVLRMSHTQILAWLGAHNDTAPLAELARERGVALKGLPARLVGPRPRWMSQRLYSTLLVRAETTLTQPHLAHHMLGHLMHVQALLDAMPGIFGTSIHDIVSQRAQGLSFDQIGAERGVSEATLTREIWAVLVATERRAVQLHQTPASQARYWLALEQHGLQHWLEFLPPPHPAASGSQPLLQPAVARAAGAHLYYCQL